MKTENVENERCAERTIATELINKFFLSPDNTVTKHHHGSDVKIGVIIKSSSQNDQLRLATPSPREMICPKLEVHRCVDSNNPRATGEFFIELLELFKHIEGAHSDDVERRKAFVQEFTSTADINHRMIMHAMVSAAGKLPDVESLCKMLKIAQIFLCTISREERAEFYSRILRVDKFGTDDMCILTELALSLSGPYALSLYLIGALGNEEENDIITHILSKGGKFGDCNSLTPLSFRPTCEMCEHFLNSDYPISEWGTYAVSLAFETRDYQRASKFLAAGANFYDAVKHTMIQGLYYDFVDFGLFLDKIVRDQIFRNDIVVDVLRHNQFRKMRFEPFKEIVLLLTDKAALSDVAADIFASQAHFWTEEESVKFIECTVWPNETISKRLMRMCIQTNSLCLIKLFLRHAYTPTADDVLFAYENLHYEMFLVLSAGFGMELDGKLNDLYERHLNMVKRIETPFLSYSPICCGDDEDSGSTYYSLTTEPLQHPVLQPMFSDNRWILSADHLSQPTSCHNTRRVFKFIITKGNHCKGCLYTHKDNGTELSVYDYFDVYLNNF